MKIVIYKILLVVQLAVLAACNVDESDAAMPDSLKNGGFEQTTGLLPEGWHLDNKVKSKGDIDLATGIPGGTNRVLRLIPNSENSGEQLLGVGQLLDASAMAGGTLDISGKLGAVGGSTAILGVHALGSKGDLGFVQIRQENSGGALKQHREILDIPKSTTNIIVYAIVVGKSGTALFDNLHIAPKTMGASEHVVGQIESPESKTGVATITVDVTKSLRVIPDTLFGTNVEWIHHGQGLWDEKRNALDQEAVALTRDMGVSLVRFPGGVFSDYYHWRDGLGERKSRPTTLHYPNGNQSKHTFGIGEVNEFVEKTNSELLITVNAGTGTAREAAEWVDFMNVKRGVGGPRVKYWEVGNELYMKGDLSGVHLSPSEYAKRFEKFSDTMRAVDPSIKIGAIGGLNYGRYSFIDDSRWTETLLKRAAGKMDFLAVHNAYAPVLIGVSESVNPDRVYDALLAANVHIERNLEDLSRLLDKYETPQREISLAVTEWGPFFHILPSSPWVDHVKTMGSALFVASTMNSFLRTPRLQVATSFKLTDHGFMGWIGNREGHFQPTALYHVFSLYSNGLGKTLVHSQVDSPTYNTSSIGLVDGVKGVSTLDVVAARDDDRLSMVVVNRNRQTPLETFISLSGVSKYSRVDVKTVTGTAIDAHTGTTLPLIPGLKWAKQVAIKRFDQGAPGEIRVSSERLPGKTGAKSQTLDFVHSFPPMSVTRLVFEDAQM